MSSVANTFTAYWMDKFLGDHFTNDAGHDSSNPLDAEDFNSVINTIEESNYNKVSFVCWGMGIQNKQEAGIPDETELTLELLSLGYKNNDTLIEPLKVIKKFEESAGSSTYPANYINELRRNSEGTFLVCDSEKTSPALDDFANYRDYTGQLISKYFPFRRQQYAKASIGTAFLVKVNNDRTKGLVVTAAHVLDEVKADADGKLPLTFYQNFCLDHENNIPDLNGLPQFTFSKLIFRIGDEKKVDFDWAVVEVVAKNGALLPEPLVMSAKKTVDIGESAYLLGHPFGLPQKLSWDGMVFMTDNVKFRCKLLSYSGSSGSPVFNDQNEVIGIYKGQDKEKDDVPSTRFFLPKVYLMARYGALCHPITVIDEICKAYQFKK